jgi:CHAT domain-containing protein/tetratricopeptide (TPR) repeat protein
VPNRFVAFSLALAAIAATPVTPATPATATAPARAECQRLNDSGRYAEAVSPCRATVDLARAGRDRDTPPGELGRALTSLGLALEMTGERTAAEASYREALALHRGLGQREQEALVLSNLAALAIGGGDYGGALAWLAAEEEVARSALARGEAGWASEELQYVRINRSVALEQLGAYAEALAEIRPLAGAPDEPGERSPALAVNLAVLYRNLGHPRRALELLEDARRIYERSADLSALANVHLNRGLVYELNLHEPAKAAAELARALELARASGDRGEEIRTLCAIGDLHLGERRLAGARAAFEEALAAAIDSNALAGRWEAEAGLGRVDLAAGDPDAALAHLRAVIGALERAGERLDDSKLRGGLLADRRGVYAAAIDLLAERALAGASAPASATNAVEPAIEALALAEQAKARELLDALAGDTVARPLAPEALPALAPRFGPTLAFFFGERQVWRWDNLGGSWRIAAAGDPGEIAERIARVHRRLASSEPAPAEDLRALGRALLPAALAAGRELRIVPDGALFYLPFELLPDPGRPDSTLLDSHPVSYLPSLSVWAHLRAQPRAPRFGSSTADPVELRPAARWRFAALAAPQLAARSGGDSLAAILARRFGLPPLPGAEREARDAAAQLGGPGVVDVGAGATEGRLRQRSREGADVLHIAAHTIVDESLAGGVALFLAPDRPDAGPGVDGISEKEGESDGLVSAPELARFPARVNLAVLSGCRTALASGGLGENVGGRSLASLSGALLGAGARGVVASLWEVDDAATAALMQQFYFELASGRPPAAALREAKLRLGRDAHWAALPRWTGFVLLGDPDAIPPGRGASRGRWLGSWPALALALAALLGGAALWFRDAHRRRREPLRSG